MSNSALPEQSVHSLPPKVSGYPLVGALPGLLKQRIDFLEAAHHQHGDIFTLDIGFTQAVILCHPRHIQHVLLDNMRNYSKTGPMWDSFRSFLGNGLLVSEGELWRRQRRMIQPAFNHQRLISLTDKMVEVIDECLGEWAHFASAGEPFDMAEAFTHMAMNLIVRTMFGSAVEASEVSRVGEAFMYVADALMPGMMASRLPDWAPFPGRTRYRSEIRLIEDVVHRIIERASPSSEGDNTILALMMGMRDVDSGERMSDEQLRDEAVTLFVAGFETTAVAMTWAFHLLTQHPDVMQRLREEVDGVLGQRTPGFADLRQLTFSRNVLQETLRLYSPSYWIPRMAEQDDEIDGYSIPAGMMTVAFTYLVHHNPSIWPDPHRFDPDRFTPELSEGRHKQAWMPFGAGQRQCIGKEFALMEGQLILARVLQRFLPSAIPGRVAQLHVGASIRTRDGMWVRLMER